MKTLVSYFKDYSVKELDETNVQEVFVLCKNNTKYYDYLQESATLDGVKKLWADFPSNTQLKDKYFVGFYKYDKLIAILDLIDGYPEKNKAFIGLFMIDVHLQGKGVGKNIILQLLEFLKSKKFTACELGVIENNMEAMSFWTKIGFVKTGQKYIHEKYNVVMLSYKF